jgi:hypothetical protein
MPAADSSALDDEVLITRVASRDSSALEQLYDRYARIVYATALRMLGNTELNVLASLAAQYVVCHRTRTGGRVDLRHRS